MLVALSLFAGCAPETPTGPARLAAIPWSLDLGETTVGLESSGTLELINSGASTLSIDSLFAPGAFALSAASLSIPPGDRETVAVRFAPERQGQAQGDLVLRSNAEGAAESRIPLQGWGVVPRITVSPTEYSCPLDGETHEDFLTVANEGPGALLASLSLEDGGGAFALDETYSDLRLEPGDARVVPFRCGADVYAEGALVIATNSPDTPEIRVPLYAEDPHLEVAFTSHSDGQVLDSGLVDLKARVILADSHDPEFSFHQLNAYWHSGRQGQLGFTDVGEDGKTRLQNLALPAGADVYTISVRSPGGEVAVASVELTLDDAPVLRSATPAGWWPDAAPVELRLSASDQSEPLTDLQASWESDRDGPLGVVALDERGAAALDVPLSVGVHQLTAAVINPRGLSDSETLILEVLDCGDTSDGDGDGYSPASGDCDDADPSVYPGSDADLGQPLGCMGDTVAVVEGAHIDRKLSVRTMSAPADLDGDGLDDLIFGDDQYDQPENNAGMVTLLLGGDLVGYQSADEMPRIRGEARQDRLGWAVASVPDVDGDGLAEVLIGSFDLSPEGTAHLLYGREAWGELSYADADLTVTGEQNNDYLGYAVTGGDMDGDGYGNLAITAPYQDSAGATSGAVYLFRGGPWLEGHATADQADLTIRGAAESGGALGMSAVSGFDFDGDGRQDLAVGAPYIDVGDDRDVGQVSLFTSLDTFGVISVADAAVRWSGQGRDDEIGHGNRVSAAGDVNGDGLDDLLLRAPNRDVRVSNDGLLMLVPGSEDPAATVDLPSYAWSWHGDEYNDLLGWATGLPDRDGDGLDELLVSSPDNRAPRAAAHLLLGADIQGDRLQPLEERSAGLLTEYTNTVGDAIGSAGDMNGDGRGDFAVTAPQDADGRVYVYLGGPTCLD